MGAAGQYMLLVHLVELFSLCSTSPGTVAVAAQLRLLICLCVVTAALRACVLPVPVCGRFTSEATWVVCHQWKQLWFLWGTGVCVPRHTDSVPTVNE